MGRSAKLHKRAQKKTSTGSASGPGTSSTKQAAISVQQKRFVAKAKVFKNRGRDAEGPVLGGVDYVDLMLGSRRKAREEAGKLVSASESKG